MSALGGGRHALVAAVAHYSDVKLQQLRAPAADAERLAEVLRDPEKGDFDVEVLVDSSHAVLTRRIARFFRDRRPTDLLLLHFSCHGVKDDRGELFLAAADTELDLLSATGVSAAWLNDQISRTRSRRTVVLLDCCFSGSFPFGMKPRGLGVDAPEQLQGRGRAIITASSAMEYAYEGDELTGEGQPSIFTAAVVDGLATGRADLDGDQLVSVDDLYHYVYDRVKDATPSQTPSKMSELEGPLYLARSSYRPEVEPATLDAELIARTEDRYAGVREGAAQELEELLSSRDPGVALAARQALSQMTADDSRRVSARAQAALAEAERAEREREQAEAEPPGEPPAEVPADRRPPAGWFRRHARLALPAAVLAVAGIAAAVLLLRDTGDGERGTPTPAAEAAAIPTANPCRRLATGWTVKDLGAQQHHECDLTTSPPPDDLDRPSLVYGLFASAAKARTEFDTGLDFEYQDGGTPCPQSALRRMREVLPNGDTACLLTGDGEYIAMWWNEDRSRVLGILDFGRSTKPENAVAAWERVISSD